MKTLILSVFVLFVFEKSFAQYDNEKALYLEKVEKYHRMKRTGTTLTLLGTGLAVAGLVTLMNVETTTTYNSYGTQQTTTDGNLGAGLAAYVGGSVMAGIGVPLWIVGGVNKGRYERKLNALTVSGRVSPSGAGLTLRYRF